MTNPSAGELFLNLIAGMRAREAGDVPLQRNPAWNGPELGYVAEISIKAGIAAVLRRRGFKE